MPTPGSRRILGRPVRRLKVWLLTAVILAGVMAFLFGGDGLWRTMSMRRRVLRMEERLDSLATLNKQMRARMIAFKADDPKVIEEEARSHGMIKRGEKVYVMQEKPKGK